MISMIDMKFKLIGGVNSGFSFNKRKNHSNAQK